MASSVRESEEFVENACCVCLKKNRSREADKYCIQCADYFCSSCLDTIHSLIPSNAGHRILGKSDFKSVLGSTQGSLPSLPTQRCAQHPSKVLEFYCADHDEVICPSCVFGHRSCREVKSIPEDIKNLYSNVKIGDMKKRFPSVKKSLENALSGQEENVRKLNNAYEKAQNEVKAFHKSLHEDLEAAKQETLTQLQDDYNRKTTKITEEINESKHLIQSLETLMSELGKMEGNQTQEFVQLKICEKLVAEREELQGKQHRQPPSIDISFTADSDIKTYFHQLKVLGWISTRPDSKTSVAEVKPAEHREEARQDVSPVSVLGRISTRPDSKTLVAEVKPAEHREEARQDVSPASVTKPYESKATPSGSKAELNTLKTSLYKVTQTTDINVSLPDDKTTCYICGSCLTEDGCLLLADHWNKKLKRLDLGTQEVRDYLTLKAEPRAVCSVSNKEVAVSLNNRTVQFVSVADKMTCTRTLRCDYYCWGIAHHNGRLFISDNGKSVYIHDMKGKKLCKISTDASGRDIFQYTRHIAVSGAGDRMYVADRENGLITLDIDGNYLSTLSGKDVQAREVRGVCTDGRNVFVCGFLSDNVVQIDQDNTPLGQIANVTAPRSLCFDSQTNTLYVTSSNVTVLQLK